MSPLPKAAGRVFPQSSVGVMHVHSSRHPACSGAHTVHVHKKGHRLEQGGWGVWLEYGVWCSFVVRGGQATPRNVKGQLAAMPMDCTTPAGPAVVSHLVAKVPKQRRASGLRLRSQAAPDLQPATPLGREL